eukprot:5331150-Prorocentrum_lima.AAC.1
MTSSLVGSEMCIRDSLWPAWSWGLKTVTFLPGWAARKKETAETNNLSAVSYTHLTLPTICSV